MFNNTKIKKITRKNVITSDGYFQRYLYTVVYNYTLCRFNNNYYTLFHTVKHNFAFYKIVILGIIIRPTPPASINTSHFKLDRCKINFTYEEI